MAGDVKTCFWMLLLCCCGVLLRRVQGSRFPTPPLPLSPMPSASQLEFQKRELALFFHFGMNTFTDSEWGIGLEDPNTFNPAGLDTRQWMQVAKGAGFKLVILTVKHHDGFCLWQSQYSNYSVRSSHQWRSGAGDVVKEFVTAASEAGLEVGLYLSPWDQHEESYGDNLAYNEYYLAQLRELLTMYGPISEVWLDGAKSETARNMSYMFQEWFSVIHQLQPSANIFSDAGPDIRWVGDEYGEAGPSCWSMMNRSAVTIGQSGDMLSYLNEGDLYGTEWVPPECDVSIRPGWFWHANEEPWPLDTLLDIYYKSVGRNCVLLLNVPPNSTGLISEEDIQVLHDFRKALDAIFSFNLAKDAQVEASSTRGADDLGGPQFSPFRPAHILEEGISTYWAAQDGVGSVFLELTFPKETVFNVLKIQEAVALGQRVSKYHLCVWMGDDWQTVSNGTTVGFKKLDRFERVQTRRARLVIDEARGPPLIASFGLYLDEYSRDMVIRPYRKFSYSNYF